MKFDVHNKLIFFGQVISALIDKNRIAEERGHKEWANILFGVANDINVGYLSILTSNFPRYIIRSQLAKYKFNLARIKADFPSFFGENPYRSILQEFNHALDDEIYAAKEDMRRNTYKIHRWSQIRTRTVSATYEVKLNITEDEHLKVYEGMPAEIMFNGLVLPVDILDYEQNNGIVTIRSEQGLNRFFEENEQWKLRLNTVWLLEAIKKRLSDYDFAGLPIEKFISKKCFSANIEKHTDFYKGPLDTSQEDTVIHSLSKDITLLWGPPGTGKSTTLSHLLLELIKRKEKTLVCCIANVALDSIVEKTLNTINTYENNGGTINFRNGQVLRLGYTRNDKLLKKRFLYPTSQRIKILRHDIQAISKQLERKLSKEEKTTLQNNKFELKKELARLIKERIVFANIVFATATKIHVDEDFETLQFDNLIIDEASMMSTPHFVALAKRVTKRIIVAGDFRQLGPVVLSQSEFSQKWLHKDIFQMAGVDKNEPLDHPSLKMLDTQRRFHSNICHIISKAFYSAKLKTDEIALDQRLFYRYPNKKSSIVYYNQSRNNQYKCENTNKGSRINKGSIEFVVKNLLPNCFKIITGDLFSIAIITPYRGQVNLYKKAIESMKLSSEISSRIKIGTIHSFQGSEADLLIYDLVESKNNRLGRLYWLNTGERLVNVAISRAKSKLIVIGDIEAIKAGKGHNNISPKIMRVLNSLMKYETTFEAIN